MEHNMEPDMGKAARRSGGDIALYQQMGAAQARLEALTQEFQKYKAETSGKFDKVLSSLEVIHRQLSEAQGGWKVMMLVGSIGVAIAGFTAWALGFIFPGK